MHVQDTHSCICTTELKMHRNGLLSGWNSTAHHRKVCNLWSVPNQEGKKCPQPFSGLGIGACAPESCSRDVLFASGKWTENFLMQSNRISVSPSIPYILFNCTPANLFSRLLDFKTILQVIARCLHLLYGWLSTLPLFYTWLIPCSLNFTIEGWVKDGFTNSKTSKSGQQTQCWNACIIDIF